MRKVIIKAVVDLRVLTNLLRTAPSMADSVPVVEFDCGQFRCDMIDDVWRLAREMVAVERQASYEKLREFGP